MGFMFNGGRCCCPDCTIGQDLFNGSLSLWTELAGGYSTAGGLLIHTTAGRLVFNTAASGAGSAVLVKTFPDVATTGKLRLIVAYYDASNYLFGELEYSANTIRLGQVNSGVERWLTDAKTITPVARPTLTLCWIPGASQDVFDDDEGHIVGEGISVALPVWTSPENITADDGVSASYLFTLDEEVTGLLVGRDCGFGIPLGSTIIDITLSIEAARDPGEDVCIQEAYIFADGFSSNDLAADDAVTFPASTIAWFGTVATWNLVGITPDIINLSTFGGGIEARQRIPPGTSNLTVDWMAITVNFTTPPRASGRLRMSYDGDCVTQSGVYAHESGLKAALEVVSGSWDFTEFLYSYHESASRPTCPACECDTGGDAGDCFDCCDAGFPGAEFYEITTNLALTNDTCTGCPDIGGTVIVETNGYCAWDASEPLDCEAGRLMLYGLRLISTGMGCCWRFRMITNNFALSSGFGATYESALLSDGEQCREGPVTLNKVSTFFEPNDGLLCNGTMPATVVLEGPA